MGEAGLERFLSYVPDLPEDQCWEWTGGRSKQGYGVFWMEGKSVAAHRVAFILAHGGPPEGGAVRHFVCDNRPCVNPAHLRAGTPRQNSRDMVDKYRHLFGEDHHLTSLKKEDVVAMRQAHQAGARPRDLAEQYGISPTAVIKILQGRSWKSVTKGVSVHIQHSKKITQYRRAEAMRLAALGHGQQHIADQLGITQAAVSWLLTK